MSGDEMACDLLKDKAGRLQFSHAYRAWLERPGKPGASGI
jgi:hypothetical protein